MSARQLQRDIDGLPVHVTWTDPQGRTTHTRYERHGPAEAAIADRLAEWEDEGTIDVIEWTGWLQVHTDNGPRTIAVECDRCDDGGCDA